MKKIVPIVEGDGKVTALPPLLYALLHNFNVFDVHVTPPKTPMERRT